MSGLNQIVEADRKPGPNEEVKAEEKKDGSQETARMDDLRKNLREDGQKMTMKMDNPTQERINQFIQEELELENGLADKYPGEPWQW